MTSACVYLALGSTDLRGTFDKLAATAHRVLAMDPMSGALFLFVNRRRNQVKALWWDRNGYVILCKRLSKGTFKVPKFDDDSRCVQMSHEDFRQLLAGLPIGSVLVPVTIH